MKKAATFLVLFCLLMLIIATMLMQTPFAKNKIRGLIEERSEGALTIGKLEGLFPFWFRLYDVQYHKRATHASFDKVDFFLSPSSLFLGHLSLIKLHINQANIQTAPNFGSHSSPLEWPSVPFPIHIHSMGIDSLTFNTIKGLSLSGTGELSNDFSLHVNLSYEDYIVRLGLEGDMEEKTINLISQIRQKSELNTWIHGIYDFKKDFFSGATYGNIFSWKIKSDLIFSDSVLCFSHAAIGKNSLFAQADITFDLVSHKFCSKGTALLASISHNLSENSHTLSPHFIPQQGGTVLHEYGLAHPFSAEGTLVWEKNEVNLPNFFLRYTDNTLHGHLTYNITTKSLTGEIDLELNDLTPSPLEYPIEGSGHGHLSIQPEQITFTLSGKEIQWKDLTFSKLSLEGSWNEGCLIYRLAIQDFVVLDPSYEVFPTTHLNLSGTATRDKLDLNGEMWGLGSTPITLLAEIPVECTTKPVDISINRNAPFFIKLKGRGSIDPILAFLENASLIARGDIDMDLALTGTWDCPVVEGTLIYENGWVESLATGALYRGIHVEFIGEGKELKIRSMIVHDLDRGDLSGTGHIAWNPDQGFPFEFTLYANCFTLLAIDPFTTNINAQLAISGNIHEMFISGSATIVEGHLAIPNRMPTQVPTLDVTYINPLPTPKPEIEERKKSIPIHWDIKIEIPRKLTIDGRGLVSEWRGNLHMSGLQDNLKYSGKLKLIQGRFALVGRTFDLTEGKIQIKSLDPKDIVVELKGDLELATITASIIVSGSLDATHLAFSSNPPMNTNQILSWILFNQDVNELTPFQACRLANVLVQLSGKYAGPSVFNNIKEGLGIDVFDITNCDIDSADLTFQIGKYISQGTFVGVSKSLSGDFDSVLIQTRLYRNFYLEGDYGGSLNGLTPNSGKLIFKWYKTY